MDKNKLKRPAIAALLSNEYHTISPRSVEKWIYDSRVFSGQFLELLEMKMDIQARQHAPPGLVS